MPSLRGILPVGVYILFLQIEKIYPCKLEYSRDGSDDIFLFFKPTLFCCIHSFPCQIIFLFFISSFFFLCDAQLQSAVGLFWFQRLCQFLLPCFPLATFLHHYYMILLRPVAVVFILLLFKFWHATFVSSIICSRYCNPCAKYAFSLLNSPKSALFPILGNEGIAMRRVQLISDVFFAESGR